MSKKGPTMSHTKAQRKLWHAGMRKTRTNVRWVGAYLRNDGSDVAGCKKQSAPRRG